MLNEHLSQLFERDLLRLKAEMDAYADETQPWRVLPGTSNAGGNLCLHVLGNLRHFVGQVLGNSGYVRNRPFEFSAKDIPLATIAAWIDETIEVVPATVRKLTPQALDARYPEKVFDDEMTTAFFLVHLLAHLSYHLGQINYHRRIIAAS